MAQRDIEKVRRDFYAISLALIIFNAAGGEPSASTSIFFGSIQITRPWVVLVGAWIVWGYFAWQFSKLATVPWARFWSDVDRYANRSTLFQKHSNAAMRLLLAHVQDRFRKDVPASAFHAREQLREPLAALAKAEADGCYFPPKARSKFRRLEQDRYEKFTDGDRDSRGGYRFPPDIWESIEKNHAWPTALRYFSLAKAGTFAAWHGDSFEDYALPYLVGAIAFVLQLSRLVWDLYLLNR